MENRLFKPTNLLWLPVVVWAATFTYTTWLFFTVLDMPSAYHADEAMGFGHVVVVFVNIIVFTLTLVLVSVYPEKQKEFLARLGLMLSNIVVAFIYASLVSRFNPYL